MSINSIRKRLAATERKKSVGPGGIPGEILLRRGNHDSIPLEIAGYNDEQ
jgi:hypothetical protein